VSAGSLSSSRLRRYARRAAEPRAEAEADEHCELCGSAMGREHRHLLAVASRDLVCACRPCALLFDRDGAGHGRFKLVPERRLRLDGFALDDATWEELRIPVDMAFFFASSEAGRVVAFYPGPMGPTESQLELTAWTRIAADNPVLDSMEDDVEALLVNRSRGARSHWLVPLDDPYALVGLIRTRWRGLSGGREVWQEIDRFFAELDRRALGAAGGR
jgi:hypothetical protein